MSDLVFQQQVVEGLEFYVSNDGDKTGMSVRGLSRCCGVSSASISAIVSSDEVSGKSLPKWLKSYAGQVFEVLGKDGSAKIISSKVCARIIMYYAYESKNAKNDVAKNTAEKFTSIGIDKWIKQLVGFEEINKDDKLASAINILIESVNDLRQEVEELKPIARKYHKVKEGVVVNFPGIDTIISRLEENQEQQPLLEGDIVKPVTLTEWLKRKRVTLDHGGYCKFGRMVAETFRSCKKEEPAKGNKKNANGKWSNGVTLYKQEHFPILEMALNQYMAG